MSSIRQQFALASLACLAITPSTIGVLAWGPGNGGPGQFDGNGGWAGCAWFGDNDCDDDGNDNSNGNSNGESTYAGQFNFTSTELNRYNKIVVIHAVLACLVWVFLIPLGGILIRSGLKSPALVKIHAALQCISYLIYIVAAAMGIYLVRELSFGGHSMWSDPHTKLGVAILVLALLMPVLGFVQHSMYKKKAVQFQKGKARPGRTIPGYGHLWLGRSLIVLGMINGGLGIRLASNSPFSSNPKTKIIGYSVGAVIMFLLYIVFVILGEVRRSKERRESQGDVRAVPMVAQPYQAVQTVDNDSTVPPSYEQSQSSLSAPSMEKHIQSTARYT